MKHLVYCISDKAPEFKAITNTSISNYPSTMKEIEILAIPADLPVQRPESTHSHLQKNSKS